MKEYVTIHDILRLFSSNFNPFFFNISAIALSDKGLRGFSFETSFLIIARIAVEDASPPVVVPT
jgi:hypothetical protein